MTMRHMGMGWRGIYSETVASAITSRDIPVDGQAFSAIRITIRVKNGSASAITSLTVQPNAVSTNQASSMVRVSGGTIVDVQTSALDLSNEIAGSASSGHGVAIGTLWTRTGFRRGWMCQYFNQDTSGDTMLSSNVGGQWTDTTTAITSIRILSGTASGIGAGSEIYVEGLR
jgi:hypothetical protein